MSGDKKNVVVLNLGSNGESSDRFSRADIERIFDITPQRLRALERTGVVGPSLLDGKVAAFSFQDLISMRAALTLINAGVKLKDVVSAVESLKAKLPKVKRPLMELKITTDGKKLIVKSSGTRFEPTTGQILLDFEPNDRNRDTIAVLRPAVEEHRARTAYDLYRQASELDETPATLDEAAKLYREALKLDPSLAIAYTNLGNIMFRKGDEVAAEGLYAKALSIDPRQPEAKYNLGYLMLERHELELAIHYLKGAIENDPRFADAYFNLAMAYEEVGDRKNARALWKRYLEIEPTGTWAEIARQHLG
jgi:DNA-binding transcriptional MerR regulator